MAANTTMEIAVVGPETRWYEEPNRAATMGVTIAVYSPYSGGSPAMAAKATPWGSTMTAPVRPANKSSLTDWRETNRVHARKGNRALSFIQGLCNTSMA